ncbi:class I SAM-dependent methyltransferase [Mesorhizobium sp. CU2]|uniref:class I SAM-dependent DNA methyltransferase n=1 Tax=unclassified Mesorhizobium TaxID=325217 RepID=UPI0011280240|nr:MULTISPECIES: class I SAM-dependent methyltransferase [unclassified Mesorhizobium]TPN89678.1 class I SAM-dependent methyltransferase [Mesorhizobium sp. CU3]TPO13942.1 class I SAM-dependent methyltransferase [Mesorhizobium sp. CU2]
MTEGKHSGALSAAYAAKRPEDVAAIYDDWSETYDADMSAAGYRHPTICLALLARHLPRGAEPVLDAGAGTGLIGEWLVITGYPKVEALDISQGMLDKAAAKGVYTALHKLAMGGPLPFADNAYAGIVSAGVFTSGHVGAEGLDELIRICRPGGVIVLTVKNTLWQAGFAERVAALEAEGKLTRVEETKPYASMPGEVDTVPSRGLVLRVN